MTKPMTKKMLGILWAILMVFMMLACEMSGGATAVPASPTQMDGQAALRAINTSGPARPFPQADNTVDPAVIRPNHRSQAQLNQDVLDYFQYWENKYVKQSNGGTPGGGYYIEAVSTGDHPWPIKSNSEAHGYGMMIYALMGDKEHYDGMWNMFNQHRSTGDPDNMSWVITEEELPSQDGGSATDGDFDVAYSMILAHEQWGSDGDINYLQAAIDMINNGLKQSDMGSSSYRTLLGDWDTDQYSTRSSDWMADHMRVYAEVTNDSFWLSGADTIYDLVGAITANYSPNTGLMPDFIINATPQPAPPNFLEFDHDNSYYYNACRFPWRVAVDYAHFGTPEAKDALDRINGWLKVKTNNNPSNIEAGYKLDGTTISTANYFTGAFAAPFITGMISDSANQDYLNAGWDAIRNNKETYYEDNVTLLCMLMISGNWWNPVDGGGNPPDPDTEAPSQPGQPDASNITDSSVTLSWSASTDNKGVTSYSIYSGGTEMKSVGGSTTATTIGGLNPESSYSFTVRAFDAAGNSSSLSPARSVTTLADQGGNPVGDNLLTNGDFSAGTNGWSFIETDGGAGSMSAGNGELQATLNQAGSQVWSTQVFQGGLLIEQGETYTVSFDARAASSRTIQVIVGMDQDPWTVFSGTEQISLGTSMQSYSFDFTMNDSTYSQAQLEFDLGLSSVNVFIDNVSLVKEGEPSIHYTISASSGANGVISPSGSVTVAENGSATFSITPNSGYAIDNVVVDGSSIGAVSSYTFSNVSANHSISATFVETTVPSYSITASAGANGSISPSGTSILSQGEDMTYSILADAGYEIDDVVVNGTSLGAVSSYQFSNVQANQSISATFKPVTTGGDIAVSYDISTDWGSGFGANVTLTNNSSTTVSSWTVTWDFPGNQNITGSWSGEFTQSGSSVTVTPLGWNGTIAPGQSVSFGFNANYSGSNNIPANILVQ